MKILFHNVLWLLFFVAYQYICLANESVTIGVLYSERNEEAEIVLSSMLAKKNRVDQRVYFEKQIKQVSNFDPFEASKVLCDALEEEERVAAIMMLESPTSPILESICSHFEVPYITTFWKEPSDTPTETVLNFFPESQLFAQALADIVKSLQWKTFAIIYESVEGLIRMQEVLKLQNYNEPNNQNKVLVKQLGPGSDHRSLLKEIEKENNIILDCKTENIIPILRQAKDQNLLQWDNNIFLTSPDAHTLDYKELNSTANITTLRLFDYESEDYKKLPLSDMDPKKIKTATVLFYDALLLLTDSINAMNEMRDDTTMSPIKCFVDGTLKTTYRYTLANYMKQKKPSSTLSGPLTFDTNGNRNDFTVYVVDIRGLVLAKWFASNTSLLLSRNANETEFANIFNLQKIVVNVSSRLEPPYLMKKEEEGKTFYGNERYEGYSMDLISEIAKMIGFKFEFIINAENEYGKFDESKNKWIGLIGDILDRKAQLAICDLTITPDRQKMVDFSVPFMNLGISILYKNEEKKDTNTFAFLDPFSKLVWIYTATLYLFISIVLYFISRMTPGDWENPHPCDEHPEELENIWDIKNCMWLTLGSIMTQGCDILPKGLSSRMAVSMWWFFSLIMTSSYTANLAAFLTKDKMEVSIDSAEALSKQTKIKYGAVGSGSTKTFFNDSKDPVYHKMWISMITASPSVFEKSNPDGVKRVRAPKGNYAFLMESTKIEYEIQTKCDLRQVGNLLDTKNYGIAMPMNSPYRGAIDKAILKLQESGKLNELKKRWWIERRTEPPCNRTDADKDAAELDLANVGGVFYVLGVGVALAVIIAIIEFLWNVRSVSVEEHLTYWEALKVELIFASKIWITKKRTKPAVSESSSSASHKSDKTDNKSIVHSILQGAGSSMNLHK